MLANDIQRCLGYETALKSCDKRDECLRYIERFTGGAWTPSASTCDNYAGFIPLITLAT